MVAWMVWDPTAGQTQPNLRAGNFIFDVNMQPTSPGPGLPVPPPIADFYRVVNVGDATPMPFPVGTPKFYVPVELQIGDRSSTTITTNAGVVNRRSTAVVMEYKVEVIDKSSVELP
jgi:hypothetical protein